MYPKITLVNSKFVYIWGEVGSNAVYYNVQIEKQKSLKVYLLVLLPPQVKKHRKIIAPHSQNEPPIVE